MRKVQILLRIVPRWKIECSWLPRVFPVKGLDADDTTSRRNYFAVLSVDKILHAVINFVDSSGYIKNLVVNNYDGLKRI